MNASQAVKIDENINQIETDICIVGGGPGGALLGFLLARDGINCHVIEKAEDFNRDFRGESLSPDARKLLENYGFKDFMDEHGYLESKCLHLFENNESLMKFEFDEFDYDSRYMIEFPQPALLEGIVEKAKKFESFNIMMGTSCQDLIIEDDVVVGVTISDRKKVKTQIRAKLVVAADGRYSRLRKKAGIESTITQTDRDVIWISLKRPEGWFEESRIKLSKDKHLVVLPTYPDNLRIGCNIPSGGYKTFKEEGVENLKKLIIELEPSLEQIVNDQIKDWKGISLLDIFIAHVDEWSRDGLVLMGDAAHTITPMMGQGIKHALFDAQKLHEVIVQRLSEKPEGAILSEELQGYQLTRKKQTDFISSIQSRQEKVFKFSSPAKTLLRRTIYRVMNKLVFLKHAMVRRVYFSQYPVAQNTNDH
ncbi:MAG: 2-polyprenyl-6-methoxyphenol hydroxylase-like FAD-dependent oxidoreductase [Arenicella sp.]|jgi:2-polyprenyl-6-methoxyphenol hydroxylase-like FAD-dependent oxidoreductase